jgi:hypothetical protein
LGQDLLVGLTVVAVINLRQDFLASLLGQLGFLDLASDAVFVDNDLLEFGHVAINFLVHALRARYVSLEFCILALVLILA